MKNKVLKLCKRLNTVTLNEMLPILCESESAIKITLKELVKSGQLTEANGVYSYQEVVVNKTELPLFFKFHTKEELEWIMKSFCIEVKTAQLAYILNVSDAMLQRFNMYFRKNIYENQLQELKKYFSENPKIPKMRKFYDIPVYFYMYDNKLFVVDKPLKNKSAKLHLKEESLKIKVLYSRLTRWINHSNKKKYMHFHIAEGIFRYGKSTDEILNYLYSTIN